VKSTLSLWAVFVALAANVSATTQNEQAESAPEVEQLLQTLEHYLMVGDHSAADDLETRARRVREIWRRLQHDTTIELEHPYLTVLHPTQTAYIGLSLQDQCTTYEAVVTDVLPNSPAFDAGFELTDTIVSWNSNGYFHSQRKTSGKMTPPCRSEWAPSPH
jgi:predicted metalloprotease with PDZ domain